ncbi:MAG: polyphosphate polymerase domain-containing protein [Clostridiales bacterium]|jgi:hypothetical protein|nr:polyphosphate polymerase domain-containing protein [Clostridiales bacterium]
MAIETFNRHENKYRLDGRTFERLEREIAARMEADAYNGGGETYPIFNIYYDTPNDDIIRASVAKPAYKEKLRLRSYGGVDADSLVYAEIKKKVGGVVNKRRGGLKLDEAYRFLANGETPDIQPYMNGQVMREIAYILRREPLKPALFLSYERLAYFGERGLRVSFDTNLLTRRYDLRLEYGAYGEPLLGAGEWLMEIKTAESIPLWLSSLLAENKAYPSSFSKYGAEYQKSLTEKNTRRIFVFAPGKTMVTSAINRKRETALIAANA